MSGDKITNETVASYLDGLYRADNKALSDLRNSAEESRVPIISRDVEKLLAVIMKIRKPATILEIGCAIGYSACFFVHTCGCKIVTLESDYRACCTAAGNIAALGFEDKISIIEGEASESLRKMQHSRELVPEKGFDIIFIDAAKSHYKEFWDLALPLSSDDALIICDNILMKGMTASDDYDPRGRYKTSIRRMRDFLDYINNLDYADSTMLPVGDGVSISVIDKKFYIED